MTRVLRLGTPLVAVAGALICGSRVAASPKEPVPEELLLGVDRAWVDTWALSDPSGERSGLLTGTVWYEDQRALGRHRDRRDLDGAPGRFRRGRIHE